MYVAMPNEQETIQRLQQIAIRCRVDIITMIEKAQSGHPGGSLSVIDILVALFFHDMKMDPKNPLWEDRDRLILSKGHGVPALYAVLAEKGILSKGDLMTLRQINSKLQGHPDRVIMPVVEASTGSLGQGLSIAQGVAIAHKMDKKEARVYCVMGDGEIQEGQVWEAAMSAGKYKLNNLIAFIDNNNGQIDGHVTEVMDIAPLADKWRSFRWAVHEVNGHDYAELLAVLAAARAEREKPVMIIAKTVKGKGVSFMENNVGWHGKAPTKEQMDKAIAEIEKGIQS
jgi:transketolase